MFQIIFKFPVVGGSNYPISTSDLFLTPYQISEQVQLCTVLVALSKKPFMNGGFVAMDAFFVFKKFLHPVQL